MTKEDKEDLSALTFAYLMSMFEIKKMPQDYILDIVAALFCGYIDGKGIKLSNGDLDEVHDMVGALLLKEIGNENALPN